MPSDKMTAKTFFTKKRKAHNLVITGFSNISKNILRQKRFENVVA